MARTRQQVSGTSALANEQTQNERHSAIDEEEEKVRRLSYVEQNVDTMWVFYGTSGSNDDADGAESISLSPMTSRATKEPINLT